MRTIFKYALAPREAQTIRLPANAKPIAVGFQGALALMLWAEVDSDSEPEPRTFRIVGTGHELPAVPLRYVGSAITGNLVWHVYEEEKP